MTELYPLTHPQKRIWYVERLHPGTGMWNNAGTLKIKGTLDFDLLERAIQIFVRRNESIRLRISLVDGQPMQYVAPFHPAHIDILDFTDSGVEGLYAWDTIQTQAPLSLIESDLYYFAFARTAPDVGYVYAKIHHLISDGVSFVVFANEVLDTYDRLLSNQELQEESPHSYLDYLKEEESYIASKRFGYDEGYWLSRFSDAPEPSLLKQKKPGYIGTRARRKACVIPLKLSNDIRAYCHENKISVFSLLLASLAIYLNRTKGKEDIVVSAPVSNRTSSSAATHFGMYVSTVPVRITVDNEKNFKDFAFGVSNDWFSVLKHQKYPYDMLIQKIRKMRNDADMLYDITLSYQIGIFEKDKENFSYEGRWHFSGQQENSLNIHWNDREGNGKFVLDYDHQVPLFSVKEIDFLHTHLLNIIADAIAHPEKKLYEIDLLSPDEYKNVTVDFNGAQSDEEHRSLLSLWEERVSETPDAQALIFHNNRLSVRELDKRSTALAQRLISLGIQADEAVALMLPRSDSYVVALLGILKAGGAFLPVDLAWPQERIDYMLADCAVRFAVCEQPSRVPQGVQVVDWRAPNTRGALPEVSPGSLAYLIYTSGSTGQPKGVMIEHHSIAHFAHVMQGLWNGPQEARMLCAGPTSFDLNVMEIVIGLLGNSTLVIADEDCANFPKQLCALIREHNINKMMVTPGRMELLLGSPEGETVLRGFEKIGLGADVLTPSLLARVQAHTNAQIYNYYGPTEVTICATCCDVTDVREANIGRPLPGVQAYILDGHLNPTPIGVPGELYVGGKGLARGYVGKEELTQTRFIPSPFIPGEKLYRTGDLCRWYPRGEILFLGRIDQQVKIRGYRIELGEIENKLLEIEGVQSCAVICREDIEDRKSLCAYVVGENLPSASKVKALLSKDLPSYMVPSHFVVLPLLPLTSNDKLDKKALPAPQDAEGLLREEFEPPVTDTEEGLALIWETILGIGEVGRNGNFFDLGGDSLSVVQMAAEVAEKFNVSLSLEEVYRTPFLDSCAALIDAAESNYRKPIRPAASKRNYPASSLQRRMFILSKQNPDSAAYNIPMSFAFSEPIDEDKMRAALDRLVKRHSILRTSLKLHKGATIQSVQKNAVLDVQSLSCTEARLDTTLKSLIHPFDIAQCPLLHCALVKTPKRHVLFLDFHHSICDQATMRILLDDLAMLYSGSEPPTPSLDYKDCAVWLDEYLVSETMQKQGEFWREQLSGELPLLDLFTEKKRTGSMRGGICKGRIDEKTVSNTRAFAKREGGTFFTAMMAAFSLLLSKQSGQEELIVGTPVSGRTHAQMQSVVGAFINTLPIVCKPDAQQSVRDFFISTSETLTRALDHQDYPFDRIVADCGGRREADRNPLFDVMLVLGKDDLDLRLTDGSAKASAIDTSTAKLDISLYLYEHDGSLECFLEYDKDLFSPVTARHILDRFIHTVQTMFVQPDMLLKDICVLPDDEYELVTQRFSATEEPYAERPLHEWIEDLALSRPDDIAVVSGGKRITFSELNRRANRIAHSLMDRGACPGTVVALMMQRGIDLMPALFGIMKTGAAYLPVDPVYPEGRVAFMLDDSCVKVLLHDGDPRGFDGTALLLDDCLAFDTQENPRAEHSMDDLAYIIYTSGSTGLPKGSMLKKRGLANLMHAMCKEIAYDPEQVGVTISTVSFDIFMVDAILPLCAGCRVVVAEEEELRQPALLARLIDEEDIAFLQATPSRMLMMLQDPHFVQAGNRHLKKIVLDGEKPSAALIRKVKKHFPGELMNGYGPTETTVLSSFQNLADTTKISIGYPISNTHFYLLDAYRKPVPIGVVAEAYISGDGVSCGYFGREDLNEKCFTPDPFRPGKTMYRTGDICCFKEDGEILIMGRADHQVKIRGLRIELGEIEARLMRCPGIEDAIVVVWGEDEHKYLCAYYCSGKELDETALRKELIESLPVYMVPSRFVRIEKLPMTANGKVDRKALPLPNKPQQDPAKKATVGISKLPPEQRRLLRVIAKALGLKQVDPSDNFFDLGGDSLAVISIQAQMMQYGMSLRTQDFYDAATLAELCENLQNEEREEVLLSTKQQISRNEIAAHIGLLEAALLSRVVVTGATGFLGAHVVEALFTHGAHEVICLVRGTSQAQAQKRLDDTLAFYFGVDHPRPRAICADITEDLRDIQDALAGVDTIINCAAWTDHVGHREDYERINVGSTQNIIDLATSLGAKLAHVSTISVSGSSAETFDESSYYIGQNVSENEYARSKFLAEGLVLDAVRGGLDARIFRVGNLAGRWKDGFFQKDVRKNAFAMRLNAFISLGQYPEQEGVSCEMTPVDLCAKALVRLLGSTVESGRIFHLWNNNEFDLVQMAALLEECGYGLEAVPPEKFAQNVVVRAQDDFAQLFGVVRDVAENNQNPVSQPKAHRTLALLAKNDLAWPEIDANYLAPYLSYVLQGNGGRR